MNSPSVMSSVAASFVCACWTRIVASSPGRASGSSSVTFQTPLPPLPRPCFSTRTPDSPRRGGNRSSEFGGRLVQLRVGSPPEVFRSIQDLLGAHLHDDARDAPTRTGLLAATSRSSSSSAARLAPSWIGFTHTSTPSRPRSWSRTSSTASSEYTTGSASTPSSSSAASASERTCARSAERSGRAVAPKEKTNPLVASWPCAQVARPELTGRRRRRGANW